MSKEVTVEWLVNHMIHNWHEVKFLHAFYSNGEWKEETICEWNDDYYENHKEDIHKMRVSLFVINNKTIKVFVEDE